MTVPAAAKGLSWPLRFGANGHLVRVEEDEKLGENIRMIVSTRVGERLMEPEFGSVGYEQLFRPAGAPLRSTLEMLVRSAITRFEPRVAVLSVKITAGDVDAGYAAVVAVEYAVRGSPSAQAVEVRIGGDQ